MGVVRQTILSLRKETRLVLLDFLRIIFAYGKLVIQTVIVIDYTERRFRLKCLQQGEAFEILLRIFQLF